jgi:predicted MFS family arabinose efflux permease
MNERKLYRTYVLTVLTAVNVLNGIDRSIIWVMLESIKRDLHLTDTQLGWLSGFAFAVVYGVVGIPIAALADRANRTRIVAAALAVWSGFTALCGFATSAVQLGISRMAVGAAESGAPPACLSIIADLYPPERRAGAIGIFMSANAIALVVTFACGAWVAERYGWRVGFWSVGVAGFVLAAIICLTVKEPLRGGADARDGEQSPAASWITGFAHTCRVIRTSRATLWMLAGFTLNNIAVIGIATFLMSLFIRTHGLSVSEAGALIALGYGVAAIGILFVGRLADRLALRDVRWSVWLVAALAGGSIVGVVGLVLAGHRLVFAALAITFCICASAQSPPLYATFQNLVAPYRRASMLSIAYVLSNLIALGSGPVIVGTLSDSLLTRFGTAALGYAILAMTEFFLLAIFSYLMAGRYLARDLRTAVARELDVMEASNAAKRARRSTLTTRIARRETR